MSNPWDTDEAPLLLRGDGSDAPGTTCRILSTYAHLKLETYETWRPLIARDLAENPGKAIRRVSLCFRKFDWGDKPFWHWKTMYRAVSRTFGGYYLHVEMAFQRADLSVYSCTVDLHDAQTPQSGRVRERPIDIRHHYDEERWQCVDIIAEPVEMAALAYFCGRQCGKPMDADGLFRNFVPGMGVFAGSAGTAEEDSYFCSKLFTSALRWTRPRLFRDVNPRTCSPEQLFYIVANRRGGYGEFNQSLTMGGSAQRKHEVIK
jgi:hypothetical protein